MLAQDQLYALIRRTKSAEAFFAHWWTKPFTWLFGRLTINVSMAFAFLTFGLIKKEVWIGPLRALHFWGYAFYFVVWPLAYQAAKRFLPREKTMVRDKSAPGLVDGITKDMDEEEKKETKVE